MTEAERLEREMFADHLKALNRLVFAAEVLECPDLPDVPDWQKSPANAETAETEDPAELRALAVAWQDWASKLDDILSELSLDDHANELAGVVAKAKAARLALIAIGEYSPPVNGGA